MITTPMLLLFALGALSGLGAGFALARLHLARHSALLNDAIRDADVRLYGRNNLHALGRRDQAVSRAAYDEQRAA